MNDLVPSLVGKLFASLRPVRRQLKVDLNDDEFLDIVKEDMIAVVVDEKWCLATCESVLLAICDSNYRNATRHFIENGWCKWRRPFEVQLDEASYLEEYSDMIEGMAQNAILSAVDDFVSHGIDDGRLTIRP